MEKFILSTINNTVSDDNTDISYLITYNQEGGTDEYSKSSIKYIIVNLQDLRDYVDFSMVRAIILSDRNAKCDIRDLQSRGIILFTLMPAVSFNSANKGIAFTISNLVKKPNITLPASAAISFQLQSLGGKEIGNYPQDYQFNKVLIDEKKPLIRSFKINPSITRSSTNVIVTYKCENVTQCVVEDQSGNIIFPPEIIDQHKPFSFEKEVHLGSKGSFPQPPFYLHATNGDKKALDNTVASIVTPVNAEWEVCDDFSEKILEQIENEGTDKEKLSYRNEQSSLLDLVLNEYQDRLWAIMQRLTPDPKWPDAQQPCLWSSPDGLHWEPYTYSTRKKNNNNGADDTILSVNLMIPEELVHCPCVHFGNNELFFVCGSKIDVAICTNTITIVNLKNGTIRNLYAPAQMKPRSLHSCLIFPDTNGNDNIWVIGGVDKHGNALNDVWCFNGTSWKQEHSGGSSFPKRCQFAATVQIDLNGEKSIWIGGGYTRFHGNVLTDIWIFKGAKWEQVKNSDGKSFLSYSDKWISAYSLCYLRTNKNYPVSKNLPVNKDTSRRYVLSNSITGIEKQLDCKWILYEDIADNRYRWDTIEGIKKPELPDKFSLASNFVLTAVGFNGCVWLVAIAYISKSKTSISTLYYSCPQP